MARVEGKLHVEIRDGKTNDLVGLNGMTGNTYWVNDTNGEHFYEADVSIDGDTVVVYLYDNDEEEKDDQA